MHLNQGDIVVVIPGLPQNDDIISEITNSQDPNEKRGPMGFGSANFLAPGASLPYRIKFENFGPGSVGADGAPFPSQVWASAPAQEVEITDALSPALDWSTLRFTGFGFGDTLRALEPPQSFFQTILPVTINGRNFEVHFEASLDLATGRLRAVFRSIDPQTSLPPDVLTGFLPPEDGAGRGQGFIEYTVEPRGGLPTGTQIRNVALISFDRQPTIATDQIDPLNPAAGSDPVKQALVTIDSGAPSSSVLALPAESGRAFVVEWSGADGAGGSGIASYDLFVATNGGPFSLWFQSTNVGAVPFIGEIGQSYAFYSIAHDNVGNTELAPTLPDAQTTVSTNSPLLQAVTNQTLAVGLPVSITNLVLQGGAAGQYQFRLLSGPYGAFVNATNGVFHWTPACEQGRTTNLVTVWVTDNTQTNLSDATTFELVVKECVRPQLGTLVLPAGGTGTLPIYLYSTEVLTNIALKVELPAGKLTATALEPVAPEICTNRLVELSNALYEITLTACAEPWLQPTQGRLVAWLYLEAASNQPSGFVYLNLGNSVGTQPDGTGVTNYVTQVARVVIVGEEPLLEAILNTNRLPALVLYAPVGTTNTLEEVTRMSPPLLWQTNQQVIMTNLQQVIEPIELPAGQKYFRAWRP